MLDWSKYPNFTEDEFRCNCGCGRADMQPEFMEKLQALRTEYGQGITVNDGGGFRCRNHPDELKKSKPGTHPQGKAADLRTLDGATKYEIKRLAYKHGFQGVGDGKTFTHIDIGHDFAARPANWSY